MKLALLLIALGACHKEPPSLARYLPAAAGPFRGERLELGARYVRRIYKKGALRVDVTLAESAMDAAAYRQWVQLGSQYPAAELGVAREAAFGFYDCAGAACSLHIQTRGGVHIEIMGGGVATRADLESLIAGLSLPD